MNLSDPLNDDELAYLARAEPVIHRAQRELREKVLSLDDCYTCARLALLLPLAAIRSREHCGLDRARSVGRRDRAVNG